MTKKFLSVVLALLFGVSFFAGRISVRQFSPLPREEHASPQLVAIIQNATTTKMEVPIVSGELARVARVIDGDTIVLEGNERVRYIGIDTPEIVDSRKPVECFGREAASRNRELVEGKSVQLARDVSDRDRYHRLLRYVLMDDVFVNLELVKEGYATASTYPPDVAHSQEFVSAEKMAREAKRGLWGVCRNS